MSADYLQNTERTKISFFRGFLLSVGFIGFFLTFSVGGVLALYYLRVDSYPSLRKLVPRFRPPGRTITLRKFRELDSASPVDIVVVGSSHAYRGFDPRIFAKKGYSLYNLGTTAQTPLNSYYMLKRYLPRLQPKVIILEVFVGSLISEDGLESFYDLAGNSDDLEWSLKMAASTRSPLSFRYLVANYADRILRRPLESYNSIEHEGEEYIPGGYVEAFGNGPIKTATPREVAVAERQSYFLKKIFSLVKYSEARIVLVTHPQPVMTIKRYSNYRLFSTNLRNWAAGYGVPYLDFNLSHKPFSDDFFVDWHHLNASGVKRFNRILLKTLRKENLLP